VVGLELVAVARLFLDNIAITDEMDRQVKCIPDEIGGRRVVIECVVLEQEALSISIVCL
jgi:hypothetical protein